MEKQEKIFISGMYFNLPSEKAPDFVKGQISIEIPEFLAFLSKQGLNNKIRIDLKVSKAGKGYAELSTWKPEKPDFMKKEEVNAPEEDISKDINPNDIDLGAEETLPF